MGSSAQHTMHLTICCSEMEKTTPPVVLQFNVVQLVDKAEGYKSLGLGTASHSHTERPDTATSPESGLDLEGG